MTTLVERGRERGAATAREQTADAPVKRFPTFGVLLGVLVLVIECRTFAGLAQTEGTLFSPDLLIALAVYVILFGGLDLLLQLVLPGTGLALLPRSALVLGAAYVFARIIQGPLFFAPWGAAAAWSLAQIYVASLWARYLPLRWVPWVPSAAIAFWLVFSHSQAPPNAPPQPLQAQPASGPSFLIVVLDTVRRDHTSTYGYERETTPALDHLAARGTRFERAYSTSSWTLPAHASLFTGVLPERHGAHSEHVALGRDLPTLAGLLARNGYATAAFSGSPMVSHRTGLTRGFHHVEEFWARFVVRESLVGYRIFQVLCPIDRDKGGADVVAGAVEWLDQRDPSRPYLLFVNLFEAHAPYQAVPDRFRRAFGPSGASARRLETVGALGFWAQWHLIPFPRHLDQPLVDLLDGATAAADSYLAHLIRAVGDDVVVIVLSDHGDQIGEHDFWGHGLVLWEPLIRIPMVMAGPGIPDGEVVAEPASIIDIMPTVLGMAEIRNTSLPGADLRSLIAGIRESERILLAQQFHASLLIPRGWGGHHSPAAVRNLQARKAAAIAGSRKRIVMEDGTDISFDLLSDPDEIRALRDPGWILPLDLPRPDRRRSGRTSTDPGTAAALRALGYIR